MPGSEDAEVRAEAAGGDDVDVLVELAGERGDVAELRRLAEAGSRDAADVLAELVDEEGDQGGTSPASASGATSSPGRLPASHEPSTQP